jgi:hypothetical protein
MFDYKELHAFSSGAPGVRAVKRAASLSKVEKEPAAIPHRNSADVFASVAIVRRFTATTSRHALCQQSMCKSMVVGARSANGVNVPQRAVAVID